MKYIISFIWAFVFSFVTIFIITAILGSNGETYDIKNCLILSVLLTLFSIILKYVAFDKKYQQ